MEKDRVVIVEEGSEAEGMRSSEMVRNVSSLVVEFDEGGWVKSIGDQMDSR